MTYVPGNNEFILKKTSILHRFCFNDVYRKELLRNACKSIYSKRLCKKKCFKQENFQGGSCTSALKMKKLDSGIAESNYEDDT